MKRLAFIILSAALLLSLNASAQSFRSGYFLDNNVYGYRINPAQVNDRSFAGLVISNIDLQNNANMGMASFLFPSGGKLVTGLNKSVSADTFLGGLKDSNYLSLDESINLLSLGFSNGESMHTIELNARVMNTDCLPRDLFALLKKGGTGSYNLGGLMVDLSALSDLSYGYSRRINDMISVGGRVHLLLGMVNVNAATEAANVTLSEDRISITPDISFKGSGLIKIPADGSGNLDLSNIGFSGSPMGGFGASVDLGAEFRPIEGLEAMVSVTDLGFISWNNAIAARSASSFNYSGGTIGFEGGTVKTDFEDMLANLKSLLNFKSAEGNGGGAMMPFNLAAGVKYKMPFYNRLSAGFLGTYHNARLASWYDLRLGATITPVDLISASANIGYGTFGPTWGAALNAHLGPVNLMLGTDSFIGKMGKINSISVPLGGFVENVHLGIVITFGRKK